MPVARLVCQNYPSGVYQYGVELFVEITTGLDILREAAIVARGYWLGKNVPDAG
jgi:hypothetical protein